MTHTFTHAIQEEIFASPLPTSRDPEIPASETVLTISPTQN